MTGKLKSLGCLFLVLLFIALAISREGQSLLSFIWTILTLIFEVIGRHIQNAIGSRR